MNEKIGKTAYDGAAIEIKSLENADIITASSPKEDEWGGSIDGGGWDEN